MSGATSPPVLRTERLRLEPLGPNHLPALRAHWTDPQVRRYLWDGRVVEGEEIREVIRTSARLFEAEGAGLWALFSVAEPDAGALVGCAGFWYFHQPPERELLISLSPERWGRGLARESALALFDFAFDRLGWDVLQASADAPNRASVQLLQRLGMRPAGERPGVFGPILVFRATRAEWMARQNA